MYNVLVVIHNAQNSVGFDCMGSRVIKYYLLTNVPPLPPAVSNWKQNISKILTS